MTARMGDSKVQILRDAARGQNCIRCHGGDETVVGAHYTGVRRSAYGGGLGRKVHDIVMAHLCDKCHIWMDQLQRADSRNELPEGFEDSLKWMHSEEFLHLCILTVIRLLDQDVLVVKGKRK